MTKRRKIKKKNVSIGILILLLAVLLIFFLKNKIRSTTKPTIAIAKIPTTATDGISPNLTYDKSTFTELKRQCIAIVYNRLSVASRTTANRSPKKKPYRTDPNEK